jgi:predicted DNA-binding transcriptional regulator AlpA
MTNPFESLEARLGNIESMLHDLKDQKNIASPLPLQKVPVSIKRVSEITQLAEQTIYGLVSARKLPHFKKGGRLFFLEDDILDWIKAGKRKTEDEIRTEATTYKKKGGRL